MAPSTPNGSRPTSPTATIPGPTASSIATISPRSIGSSTSSRAAPGLSRWISGLGRRAGKSLYSSKYSEERSVKISARNRLKGKIVEVKKGATTAHIRLDVSGTIVTASITNEAVDELGLKVGQTAYAIIKASDVMVGLDE